MHVCAFHFQAFSRLGSHYVGRVGSGQGDPIRPVSFENLLARPVTFEKLPDPTASWPDP